MKQTKADSRADTLDDLQDQPDVMPKERLTRRREKPVVVVTGSTSLIGTALLRTFSKDYTVIGLDLKRVKQMPVGTPFVPCDLRSDESVTDAFRLIRSEYGKEIASVVHLATADDGSGEGTSRLLRGLAPFRVGQFVFSGTLATENVIRQERGNIPAVILRTGGVLQVEDFVEAFRQVVARRADLGPLEVFPIAEPEGKKSA